MSAAFVGHFFPHAHVTCIDSWENIEDSDAFAQAKARYEQNTAEFADRRTTYQAYSSHIAHTLPVNHYKLIYIDGSHYADDVLNDALDTWHLLQKGGFMVFDDFIFRFELYKSNKNPPYAIKAFIRLMRDECRVVAVGPQVIIQKIKDRAELEQRDVYNATFYAK